MQNGTFGRGTRKRRDLVESVESISVFELRRQNVLQQAFRSEEILCRSGRFWFYRKYDPSAKDFYLELKNRGPRNYQSTISFVETPCNYGGTRWWFECPRCQRRAAKLYERNDDFYCRICLDLEYRSHLINYHSIAEVTTARMLKLQDVKFKPEYSFYRRRMTRRARQEEKLRWQVERGTELMTARFRGF